MLGSMAEADAPSRVSLSELQGWVSRLHGVGQLEESGQPLDAQEVDRIAVLEQIKSACAAGQAQLSASLLNRRLRQDRADAANRPAVGRHADPDQVRRGVAAEIGLARHESPARARRMLGLAQALTGDMPATLAALADGATSEYRAQLVAQEFGCLSADDRRVADREIGPRLAGLGDLRSRCAAAGIAARLDPEAVLAKIRGAVADRRVSIRPAPDTMVRLSALLPLVGGIAVYKSLCEYADSGRACGDERSRNQIMADELVARLTNPAAAVANGMTPPTNPPAGAANDPRAGGADPATPGPSATVGAAPTSTTANTSDGVTDPSADIPAAAVFVPTASADDETNAAARTAPTAGPVERVGCDDYGAPHAGGAIDIQLVMTDRALFDGDGTPALVTGYGPIPAALARHLIATSTSRPDTTAAKVFLHRLFTDSDTGQLVAMDSRAREFPAGARRFLIARDQICRTPWCDAPIRHIDHINPAARGGPTTIGNGQSLCANCNYTKQSPGWSAQADPDGRITVTTPTGRTVRSRPADLPSSPSWPGAREVADSTMTVARQRIFTSSIAWRTQPNRGPRPPLAQTASPR